MLFEMTISAEKSNEQCIDFLYEFIKCEIKKTDATVARNEVDERIFFSVACAQDKSANLNVLIVDALAEIFSLGFKNEYLRHRLEIGCDNLLSRTVLNTMTVLDSGTDRALVKRALKGIEKIALEGFFEFRLQELRDRWDEVIFLANSNSVMFADKMVVCDFLSFLIDAIPQTVNIVRIVKQDAKIELLDEDGKSIAPTRFLSAKQATEESLLFDIICLSPKKVIVEDKSNFSYEFNDLICKFF